VCDLSLEKSDEYFGREGARGGVCDSGQRRR